MLIISYLNGINHETVSKQFFFFLFSIYPFAHHTEFLWYRSVNKYCHLSSTSPIAAWLEGHAGKQGVAGSNPGGGIGYHFEFSFISR